jgi:AmmeMemoRadiSam system protein B
MFYPSDPAELRSQLDEFLASVEPSDGPSPKAIIVPHAGYVYSGAIAATVYARLRADGIRRVILLGPSHYVLFRGVVASAADVWRTPLGLVPVETAPGVPLNEAAHEPEHCLEVQLPFLQTVLNDFALIPLVAGNASAAEVAEVLRPLWGGPETLVVISSDLSHYQDYQTARTMDRATARAILELSPGALESDGACGCVPVEGVLLLAKEKGLRSEVVDLRNSGDTAGSKDQVVGYGAFAFYEQEGAR